MTEPIDYKARIKAKGTDGTGITREHAQRMASTQGGHTMLIVDVQHARKIIEEDGSQTIQLTITSAEPVPAENEEEVRRYQRALYLTRPDVAGQAALAGTSDGESPSEALAGMTASIETDADGQVSGMWDGDPDAPLTSDDPGTTGNPTTVTGLSAVPDQPADEDSPGGELCPFPDCGKFVEHDGPHRNRAGLIIGSDVDEEEG